MKIEKLNRQDVVLEIGITERLTAPKGVVQILHGAKEHKERYGRFAEFLAEHGYHVVIHDHRGHGASVSAAYPLGYMDKPDILIDDAIAVRRQFAEKDDLPIFLLGHSFGSLLARQLLRVDDRAYEAVILTGSPNYPFVFPFLYPLLKHRLEKSGPFAHDPLIMKVAEWEDNSWVCSDPDIMAAYNHDPLCTGYRYPNASCMTMVESVKDLAVRTGGLPGNPDIPILLLAGEDDPITGGRFGHEKSALQLRRRGYRSVETRRYPGMKHEILNETEHELVDRDILEFLDRRGKCDGEIH